MFRIRLFDDILSRICSLKQIFFIDGNYEIDVHFEAGRYKQIQTLMPHHKHKA